MERKEIKVGSVVRDGPQVARKINGLGTCQRSEDEKKVSQSVYALPQCGVCLQCCQMAKLIPSFPSAPTLHPGATQGKEWIKFRSLI